MTMCLETARAAKSANRARRLARSLSTSRRRQIRGSAQPLRSCVVTGRPRRAGTRDGAWFGPVTSPGQLRDQPVQVGSRRYSWRLVRRTSGPAACSPLGLMYQQGGVPRPGRWNQHAQLAGLGLRAQLRLGILTVRNPGRCHVRKTPAAYRSAMRSAPRAARRPARRALGPTHPAPGRRALPCCRSARRSGRRWSARR